MNRLLGLSTAALLALTLLALPSPAPAGSATPYMVSTVTCKDSCTTTSKGSGVSSESCTVTNTKATCTIKLADGVVAGPDFGQGEMPGPFSHLVVTDTGYSSGSVSLYVVEKGSATVSGSSVTATYVPLKKLQTSSVTGVSKAVVYDLDKGGVLNDLKVAIDGKAATFKNVF